MSKPAETKVSIPERINVGFSYYDRDINAVNEARNARDGFKYLEDEGVRIAADGTEVRYSEPTGILLDAAGNYVIDDDGNTIVELPACAVDQGSPIIPRLEAQLKQLAKLGNVIPAKILFPYKLSGFHWNVGEIVISKDEESGKFQISGTAYDSYGSGELEERIRHEIYECFVSNGYAEAEFFLDKKTKGLQTVQSGGLACGLYAAIAMHNLKKHAGIEHVWDGIFNADGTDRLSDLELRQMDYFLVQEHNPRSLETFCQPLNLAPSIKIDEDALFGDMSDDEKDVDETLKIIDEWKAAAKKTVESKSSAEEGLTEVTRVLELAKKCKDDPLFMATLALILCPDEKHVGIVDQAVEEFVAEQKAAATPPTTAETRADKFRRMVATAATSTEQTN